MRNANYIGLAYQFWNLTRESIVEMEKLNNKNLVLSDHNPNLSEEENWELYANKTRWNDFNVGVPILFNFYHGLELIMKGLLQEIHQLPRNKSHKLSDYYSLLVDNEVTFGSEIINLIGNFINANNPFSDFFTSNNGDVNDFYIYLRYPEPTNESKEYSYKEIRGNEMLGLRKFLIIKNGCSVIKIAIEKWKKEI